MGLEGARCGAACVLNQHGRLDLHKAAVIEEAAGKYEPSIVTRHIIQIASTFNRFYHDEHILVEDADERIAKIALVAAAGQVIRNGLHLLGIEAPERM